MKYSEAIEPVTTLKTRSAELIRRARDIGPMDWNGWDRK